MLESLLMHTEPACISIFGLNTGIACTSSFSNILSPILQIMIPAGASFVVFRAVERYLAPSFKKTLPQATGGVRISSQVFFVTLPPMNFWAFYRIKRLRRYIGFVTIATFASTYLFGIIPGVVVFFVISLYLIVKWSRQHNKQFDQPTPQPTEP